MKTLTEYLKFHTKTHRAYVHITPQVEQIVGKSGVKEGMVLAIEPMVNIGDPGARVLEDKWTAVTTDGSSSAHFEHCVAVTKDGPVILTQ